MRQYWIRNGNRESGPYTREQLEVRIAMGHIRIISEVRETDGERSTKWLCVGDISVLRELVERYSLPEECMADDDSDNGKLSRRLEPHFRDEMADRMGELIAKQQVKNAQVLNVDKDLLRSVVFALACLGVAIALGIGISYLSWDGGGQSTATASPVQPPPLYLPEPDSSSAPTGDDPDEWQRFYQTPEGKRQMQRDLESLEQQLANPKTSAEVERILKGGK
jgi:hypothetical protein